jgi:hypothetical protein
METAQVRQTLEGCPMPKDKAAAEEILRQFGPLQIAREPLLIFIADEFGIDWRSLP